MNQDENNIGRLRDDLYRRNPSGTTYQPHEVVRERDINIQRDWEEKKPEPPVKKEWHVSEDDTFDKILKILFVIGAIVFLLAIGFAAYRFIVGLNVIDSKKVDLSVDGPVSLKGGDVLELEIAIKNNNEIPLESVTLIMEYPAGTRSSEDIQVEVTRDAETLGTIPQGGEVVRTKKAVMFGEKDSVKDIVAKIEYRVEGSNATFTKEETYPVTITSSPLIMTVDYPEEVNSGQEIDVTITVASNSNQPIEGLLVRAEYPFGFEYRSSSPEPRFNDSVWRLGTINPGEKDVINIKGRIQGQENEERTFRFYAGEAGEANEREIAVEFISSQETLVIRRPFVALSLTLDGTTSRTHTARMGELNKATISWQSNLESALDDALITVSLQGDSLDENSVVPDSGGFYRSIDNTITWDKNNFSKLAKINPGDKGSVTFEFRTISPSPSVIADFENTQIDVDVELAGRRFAQSGDMAQGIESRIDGAVKIVADLSLTPRLVYRDGPFDNSGPLPPEAEKETTYTVLWTITNAFNDCDNVEVRASLSSYVQWKGQVSPNSNIEYIQDTREVVWRPGYINAGAGFLEPSKDIAFKIGFLPSKGQIGSVPVLVSNIRVTGRDLFSDEMINVTRSDLTTRISTDSGFQSEYQTVRTGQ